MNKHNAPKVDRSAPFQKIDAAATITGLSQYYLRNGCKDGSVPCIRSGRTYFINIPALLRQLDAEEGGTDGR